MATRVALVTTLLLPKGSSSVLASFVKWHTSLGIDTLYLYFDDSTSDEPEGWREADHPQVKRVRRSPQLLEEQQEKCACWARFGPYATEVQARQALNAEHASLQARRDGCTWLLHLDVDELFFVKSKEALLTHFRDLDAKDIGHCTYANHEGVAERSDVRDYFREVTLFRWNHHSLPLTSGVQAGMRWWRSRSKHGQYLLCYDCGKSAVKLVDDIEPVSVHAWRTPLKKLTALCDARLDLSERSSNPEKMPVILHYVNCGTFWLRTKYEILGAFADSWFGGSLPIAPSFHLEELDLKMILPLEFIPLVRPFLPLHRPLPLLVLAVPPALARLKLRRVDPRPPLDGQRGLVLQVLPRQNPFVEEQENSTGHKSNFSSYFRVWYKFCKANERVNKTQNR